MLDKEIRAAVLTLSSQGHSQREIAKALHISRTSVQGVLKGGEARPPRIEKTSQLDPYRDEIQFWHKDCRGNLVRVAEKLEEEKGVETSYSSLTWFCRKNGIGVEERRPAQRIITGPGEEMQHDTSPYVIEIGGKKVKRQGASLVLGHSRMLYVQFYPAFNRFICKIFLTKAFQFFGGVSRRCVIDNSSVVIACGAGPHAQVAPEMEAFEKRFGFHFYAHAVGHADRSGKVERPFSYVEGNFLAGRRFKDDEDLNAQALRWVQDKANRRVIRELQGRPQDFFVTEKPHLVPLPLHIPEVYRPHQRDVDAYCCVNIDRLSYPVPPAYLGRTNLIVRETEKRIIVMDGPYEVVTHPKKQEGSPPPPSVLVSTGHHKKNAHIVEEDKVKALGEPLGDYLKLLKNERGPRYRASVRKLYHLMCQYKPEDVKAAVKRALEYRLTDIMRVETVLLQNLAERDYHLPLGFENVEPDSPVS